MKQFLAFMIILVAIIATGFCFSVASAAGPAFLYVQGGTGSSTIPAKGQVFYAGATAWQSEATGTITCSGTASCGAGSYVLGSNLTITGSGGSSFPTSTNPLMATYFVGTSTSAASVFPFSSTTVGTVATLFSTNATTSTFAITGGTAANCNGTNALTTNSSGTVTCSAQAQGTVTSVSVATANGFAGSSSGGATPSLTLTTTITGLLKGNGTAISAAAYTDFPTISANSVLANQTNSAAAPSSLATSSLFSYGNGLTQSGGVQRQIENRGFTLLATTTSIQGTTTIPLETAAGATWNYVRCSTSPGGSTMDVDFYYHSLATTPHLLPFVIASSTNGIMTFTTNNIIPVGATTSVDVGTPVNSPVSVQCTVNDTI